MFADIEPEIDMQCAIPPLVGDLDVILDFEFARSAGKTLLQERGKTIYVLDVVADDAPSNEVAAGRKGFLRFPSFRKSLAFDAGESLYADAVYLGPDQRLVL